MTDYFGALLRSAGALPASAPAPGGADIVEQEVEIMAGEAPARSPRLAEAELPRSAERASDEPQAATFDASPPGREASAPRAEVQPRPQAVADDKPLPRPMPFEGSDFAHPAVQAALRWVAADPQAPRVAASAAARAAAPAPQHPADPPRVGSMQATPRPALEERIEAASLPQPARELDLSMAPASHARPAALAAETRPSPSLAQPSIDLHIGTIHVAVDAPAPRLVAQPAPQPAASQPSPLRTAERSGFARARLPRF